MLSVTIRNDGEVPRSYWAHQSPYILMPGAEVTINLDTDNVDVRVSRGPDPIVVEKING